jgi:hypothetical protein
LRADPPGEVEGFRRCVMRGFTATLFVIALASAGIERVRADDEYVKVALKGCFGLDTGGVIRPGPRDNPTVKVNGTTYDLDLTELPSGAPALQAMEAMQGETVIVRGSLVMEKGKRARVVATVLKLAPPAKK